MTTLDKTLVSDQLQPNLVRRRRRSWITFGILGAVVVAIGIDRLLGYGLKYPPAFKDIHFQHL